MAQFESHCFGVFLGAQAPGATTHLSALAFFLPAFDLPSTLFPIPPPCTFHPLLSEADSLAFLSALAFNILLLPNRVLEEETGAAWTDQITKGTWQVATQPSSHIWTDRI